MSRTKLSKKKWDSTKTAIILAVIGLIGTIITAYLGYLSNTRPTELAISATQTANEFTRHYTSPNSPIKFLSIPDKESLVKTFKLEGSGTRINLRFIANNFDIDFDFSAPLDMECYVLVNNITQHFGLDRYLEVDMSKFPTGYYNSIWYREWLPIINGVTVDPCSSQTLSNMAVTDGDLIGLKIKWVLMSPPVILVPTTSAWTPTPLPTYTPGPMIYPPEVFP